MGIKSLEESGTPLRWSGNGILKKEEKKPLAREGQEKSLKASDTNHVKRLIRVLGRFWLEGDARWLPAAAVGIIWITAQHSGLFRLHAAL